MQSDFGELALPSAADARRYETSIGSTDDSFRTIAAVRDNHDIGRNRCMSR